jgi:hypothetical protein
VDIKTVGLLPNARAKQAALEAKAFEALLTKPDGTVTEACAANAWIVTKDKVLVTHPLTNEILGGITRDTVLRIATRAGYQVQERAFSLDEALAADARQAVGWPVTREALLADPAVVRQHTCWTVFAVVTETQPDRLRRIETWLCREQTAQDDAPQYAVLIDFVPVTGAASSGYVPGDQFEAELVYYRSSLPLRAVIASVSRGTQPSSHPVPAATTTLAGAYSQYERALQRLPWLGSFPLSFREATVRRRDDQLYLCDQQLALPVHSSQRTQALPLTGAGPLEGIGLWNGYELTLACAETPLGRWVR